MTENIIKKSLAFAKNQADHIVAEAQSLKDRQITRGLIRLNQRKFQLQKLEKERELLGRQNQIWQRIHADTHTVDSTVQKTNQSGNNQHLATFSLDTQPFNASGRFADSDFG